MRIIGGKHRGLRLASVGKGDAAAHLRPTTDRTRESLFNVLANYDLPEGTRVLDLFAGTGALGCEALSRGATHVTFVDDGVKARALIRRNIDMLQAQGVTDLYRRDATRLGDSRGRPYDLIFLDPPYGKNLGQTALAAARSGGWLANGAMIVWEESAPMTAPPSFELIDHRRYGDSHITLMRFADEAITG